LQPPGSGAFLRSEYSVALPCIRKLVAASSFAKPKVLTAASTLKFIPEELVIFCRDFRLLRFHFHENGLAPQAFRVANAIAQARETATWPGDTGYGDGWSHVEAKPEEEEEEDEEGDEEEDSAPTLLFESLHDWEKELKRLGAAGWRVSAINERFDMAPSLPRYLWVPSGLLDHDLKRTFAHFEERRVPRLCWHHPCGSDLLRSAGFHAASEPGSEDVRWPRCWRGDAAPSSCKVEWGPWGHRGGRGQQGPPLHTLHRLVPPETSDRDLNCLVASLVQLLADPHARTLPGFQSLVQREWVAAGHPFPRRLGLRRDSPREEAPVFLLFLDCTWQLVRQFPAAFGFTEAYLLALHDSSFLPYCSTFLFSCQRQRGRGGPQQPRSQTYTPVNGWWDSPQGRVGSAASQLPPVWDWALRYSRQQRARFRNPAGVPSTVGPPDTVAPQTTGMPADAWPGPGAGAVFVLAKGSLSPQPFPWRSGRPPPRLLRWAPSLESLSERGGSTGGSPVPTPPRGLLLPCAAGPSVRLWRRCYLRGLPEAQRGRFAPSPAGLAEELTLLQDRLSAWQAEDPRARAAGSPLAPSR
ncbi:MTRAB protein, partial [Anseranas semipalmata]|nr:MTRAB protein [Anseranas semipalmata]